MAVGLITGGSLRKIDRLCHGCCCSSLFMQQFLCFLPLPHGHGSLRPTFFSTILGLGRFSNSVKSEISSGLSGSSSILYFHPFSSNAAVTSLYLLSVCTLTTAGFFSVPNFACFTPLKIRIRFPTPGWLFIFPTSVILLPIALLFQISWELSIPRQGDQHETKLLREARIGGRRRSSQRRGHKVGRYAVFITWEVG